MDGQYGFGSTLGLPVVAVLVGIVVLGGIGGGIVLLVWLLRKGGASTRTVLLVLAVPFVLLALAVAALIGWKAMGGMSLEKFERMQLHANHTGPLSAEPPGLVQQTQNGFRLQLPPGQLATFELLIRQADDSFQPLPALAALVATSTNASFNDTLYWTLRRADPARSADLSNQLWFWSVTAHDGLGRALAQRPDHGTNFSHALAPGETLDWWQLALPGTVTFGAGERKDLPLFRTHGTATARGVHPKEAILRVRCAATPTGFVTNGTPRIELGLAAHALLEDARPATKVGAAAAIPQHIQFKVLRVENPPGTRDILLHFERDTNYGLALEVSQDVTPSPGLRKQPQPGHRTWQQTTWVGVRDRVLGWTLPQEFTAAEVRVVVKDMEQRSKTMRQLPDGAVPEFATALHRDGWKYHLVARVKREPGTANPPPHQPGAPASSLHP